MEQERQALEAPLLEIDPELNVFALANGLDLLRNRRATPDRILEWYREGMDRRIHITAAAGEGGAPRYTVSVEASRKRDGVTRSSRRDLEREVPFDQIRGRLRPLLAEGIEQANEIDEEDLSAAG